ncbi:MAG: glycoside hydrolase domain-containing protein, partial [Armatimonadota bacterium]
FNTGQRLFAGIRAATDSPGVFGRRCARTDAPDNMGQRQPGWMQTIPVQGGHSYLYAGWIKCRGVEGAVTINGRCQTAEGRPAGNRANVTNTTMTPPISGDTDWTQLTSLLTMPEECAQFDIRLTQQEAGSVWHDGIVMAEVQPTVAGGIEEQASAESVRLSAWPVEALVKVFQEARPPTAVPAARITCARNEKEPLQLAVRGPVAMPGLEIEVTAPRQAGGAQLPSPQVGVVGYVPIDYPSNSYNMQGPVWHRMFPTGTPASDGFPGWWPDPILPRQRFDLAAGMTQPVWLTISVPADAVAGDYTGLVRFTRAGDALAEVPFTVHVWDFALPTESHLTAIFGRRGKDSEWEVPGQTSQQRYEALWKLMADYRICPTIIEPEPVFTFEQGQCQADFTEFDREAAYCFDTLKMQRVFTPFAFYGFGWGYPPGKRFGQAPYEGEFPYVGADRSRLRPEYKAAYQACLRVFLDHLKQKGWYDKFIMYLSDEPHFAQEPIRTQLTVLSDMIREVDPKLPIYASTWDYRPDLDGTITVWGLGHYGVVPANTIRQIEQGGAKVWWTTDGQICIDTPYCAVERLLPYYCFKYGAEAYEYYSIDVLLGDDPYQFGWHHFTPRSLTPGDQAFKRVHDGGGYLLYPGRPPDPPGPVPTIRLEQVREGMEDYEYL